MTAPLKPSEVIQKKAESLPDFVIEAFNLIISENWNGHESRFTQDEIVSRLVKDDLARHQIFERHYLDVEDIYRKEGWKVVYDKPGYNETYPATFTFSKSK